jgi:hypothetical protein
MKRAREDTKVKVTVKVVSGGQTGADLAALRAAKDLCLETGGIAARGFWNEDGAHPEYAAEFGLTEDAAAGYVSRTKQNVDLADCTVAFLAKSMGPSGTSKTVGYALSGKWRDAWEAADSPEVHRPTLVLTAQDMQDVEPCAARLRAWLSRPGFRVVNVAGHRASLARNLGLDFDYTQRCYDILKLALQPDVQPDAGADVKVARL